MELVEGPPAQPPDVVEGIGLSSQLLITGDDNAALAACERLAHLQGKCAEIAESATAAPPVLRTLSMGAILDEEKPVPVGDVAEAIHVRRKAAVVHRQNTGSARGDGRLQRIRIHLVGIRLDVHDDGDGIDHDARCGGGNERRTWHDDLITGLDTDRLERHLDGLSAVGAGHRRLAALILDESVLKSRHP